METGRESTASSRAAPAGRDTISGGRTRGLLALAGLVALACGLLWPLPRVWDQAVLAAADQEAASHIWGLWAALREGQALVLDTDLLASPDGVRLVLVDPANLPGFALGQALGGPAAGYNAVLLLGILLCGLAGWLLAVEVGGAPWLGAVAAMCCPALLAGAADGQTECFAVGWVGVQLALLLRFLRLGGLVRGLGASFALALCWYGGPYNGLFASGIDAAVGLAALARSRAQLRPSLRWLAIVALPAAALVSPLLYAILFLRDATLPGSESRAGLPSIESNPSFFRGGLAHGADLLDPFVPAALTGGEAPVSHTAYLGLVALVAATLAMRGHRHRWPWLAGAFAFAALSLGPWIYVRGEVLRVGDQVVPGPAGLLMMAVPVLGRVTRWYRAGAVATLLLAPLVSLHGRRGPAATLGLVGLLIVDTLLLSPLVWPLRETPLPAVAAYEALPPGAVLELPRRTSAEPPPGQWRDRTALAQTLHGRPLAGTIMGLPEAVGAPGWQAKVEALMRTGRARAEDLEGLRAAGFRGLALLIRYRPAPPDAIANLNACLGPPTHTDDEVWMYDLEGHGPGRAPDGGCSPLSGADSLDRPARIDAGAIDRPPANH